MTRTTCRSCGSLKLEHVIDLGNQAPSNALLTSFDQVEKTYPLRMCVCTNCWLLQTEYDVPHAELFPPDYPYHSGSNQAWGRHCKAFALSATERFRLTPRSYVVEVGGNDGTLLDKFACETFNIEPSVNVAREAMRKGIATFVGRFQDVTLTEQADLIIANNVLAHDPDLNGFAASIARNLAEGGTCTIEFPWAMTLLWDAQFDTIYHEHYSYLSVTALASLFARHGLCLYDVEHLTTHGGSIRAYVGRQQARVSVLEMLRAERWLQHMQNYERFRDRAFNVAGAFTKFVTQYPGQVYAAGAAAKATVFANFCGLTSKDIVAVGDATPAKQGKFLPGSRIPIMSEEQLCARQPTFIWIAAWNWRDEIAAKYRALGFEGKFVTAIPELEVF